MGVVREAVAARVTRGEGLEALRARTRAWLARHDVRVALAATLALRLATSLFTALLVSGFGDTYRHVIEKRNVQAPSLGITLVPVSLDGLASYLTGPWLRWDADIYVLIARGGYSFYRSTAFMPLYPLLVRLGSYLTGGHFVVSALLVSTAATFAALSQLHRLAFRLTGTQRVADFTVLVACLLPVAFFFVAPYSESLFLALSLACILAALDGRWAQAAAWAALAALARQQGALLGVLAVPAIWAAIRAAWNTHAPFAARLRSAWEGASRPALVPLASVGIYAAWLGVLAFWLRVPTPVQALTSQQGWNQHFTLPGLGVLADLALLVRQPGMIPLNYLGVPLDASAALVTAALLIVAWQRLPAGLGFYLLACWCVAVVKVQPGGETVSAARYLLAALPLAAVPATWLARGRPALRVGYVALAFLVWIMFLSEWVFWSWVN
ncbi:MAG TPA: mannosyltransferase family protein [Ktedonobacterales bacterium]|nr:mannosyltransferase family protein [Ktedonobacterales bacterium]